MSTDRKVIALLPWGNVIEDFLDDIGLTLDQFCDEMTGGWLFGYVEALRLAGWEPVLMCVSRDASVPARQRHRPSGMTVCLLPAWSLYASLADKMKDPYGWTIQSAFGHTPWFRRLDRRARKELVPYLATPLGALASTLRRESCRALLVQEYEHGRFDMCVLLGRWLRLPVFATFQGGDRHVSSLESLLRPVAMRAATGFAVGAPAEAKRLVERYGVSPRRIWPVHNPIDLEVWYPASRSEARRALGLHADARVVVWHGRVDRRRKGLDVLIDAWERLTEQFRPPNTQLLLIGSGADDQWLRQRLDQLPGSGIEWVAGYELKRSRIRRYLCAADLYVLPSRVEGFPVAPLEAMACGLPVIASDIPALAAILHDGINSGGVLVPAGDPEQLARALASLVEHPTTTLGEAARRTVQKRFSHTAVSAQLGRMLADIAPTDAEVDRRDLAPTASS